MVSSDFRLRAFWSALGFNRGRRKIQRGAPTRSSSGVFLPAGTALFAATGEFVYGGPSSCFRSFRAQAFFLVTGFDVGRLTFLFVSVAGFIALRHGCSSLWFRPFFSLRAPLREARLCPTPQPDRFRAPAPAR